MIAVTFGTPALITAAVGCHALTRPAVNNATTKSLKMVH